MQVLLHDEQDKASLSTPWLTLTQPIVQGKMFSEEKSFLQPTASFGSLFAAPHQWDL